jgi:hypothetical protein
MTPLFQPFDFKAEKPMDTKRPIDPSNPVKPPDTLPSSTPGGEPQSPNHTAEGVVPAEGDPSAQDGAPDVDPKKAGG